MPLPRRRRSACADAASSITASRRRLIRRRRAAITRRYFRLLQVCVRFSQRCAALYRIFRYGFRQRDSRRRRASFSACRDARGGSVFFLMPSPSGRPMMPAAHDYRFRCPPLAECSDLRYASHNDTHVIFAFSRWHFSRADLSFRRDGMPIYFLHSR
jgi:hypothetical protein